MENKLKRVPKNPITFQVDLNAEQAAAKASIHSNKITILTGRAGSGKTLCAVMAALEMLFKREVERIILSRSIVTAGEELGLLPGAIDSKLEPYVAPLMDALYKVYKRDLIDKLVHDKKIEVIPIGVMRGRNLADCVAVIDEAQNITNNQTKLILTRLCKGSKMILCGDTEQIDIKDPKQSGFAFICQNLADIEGVKVITLQTNHRDELVDKILEKYTQK